MRGNNGRSKVLGVVILTLFFGFLLPLPCQGSSGVEGVFSENLQMPWEIAFLSDGDVLVTERPGVLKRIGENQASYNVLDIYHVGEGGLLGMAFYPEFSEPRYL